MIISSLFISGFPKVEDSNINFYLESKASFTNICSFNKKVLTRSLDANCDKVENFCMHNINSESIFEKLLLDKQIRYISKLITLEISEQNRQINKRWKGIIMF